MSERSKQISKLLRDEPSRAAYIKGKLGALLPSQIRALRLKSNLPRQEDLAREAHMQQSRISMFETPGAANMTVETLSKLAAFFKVGLIVKFVPFSEMLHWENTFSQDRFDVIRLDHDHAFLNPTAKISPDVLGGTVGVSMFGELEAGSIFKHRGETKAEGIHGVLRTPFGQLL